MVERKTWKRKGLAVKMEMLRELKRAKRCGPPTYETVEDEEPPPYDSGSENLRNQ